MTPVHEELRSALDTVLPELRATTALSPAVQDDQWSDYPGQECAMLWAPDGSGMGIWVLRGESPAAQAASLADQVQDWAHEELQRRGATPTWPPCPMHPDTHPLRAVVDGDQAAWRCPTSIQTVAPLGQLARDGPPSPG